MNRVLMLGAKGNPVANAGGKQGEMDNRATLKDIKIQKRMLKEERKKE